MLYNNKRMLYNNERLNVIVVGLGRQASQVHLPAVTNSLNFELIAVCDLESEKTEAIGKQYSVPGYTDLNDLINGEDFQVAIVSVPHCDYLSVIEKLSTAGKHIIKEKPFATDIDEALKILQLVNGKVYLGVTLQRRFNPIYRIFHDFKESIGKIYTIEGTYTMNIPSLDEGWRARKEFSGGGALVDMGYHMVDLSIWYFGMPTSVTALTTGGNRLNQNYDVEDTVHLLFGYHLESPSDKFIGNFFISRVGTNKQEYIKARGTDGVVETSRGLIRLLDLNGNEIKRIEHQDSWYSAPVEQLDHFAEEIRRFVPGIPEGNCPENIRPVAVIEAAYESDRLGTSCYPSDYMKRIQEIR